jgi:ribosomal protein S18 acetylase RimI-like enzyme
VESSEAAYGSLARGGPAELARRTDVWHMVVDDSEQLVFVAEAEEQVVGVLNVGPARNEPGLGELYVIYVHPNWWGSSAAQQLIDRAHEELGRRFRSAVLTVVASNPRARRFYERTGGV